jgi:transposase
VLRFDPNRLDPNDPRRSLSDPGYQYSQFCEHYRRWCGTLKLVMRQVHRAGEKVFVDYAGLRPCR